MPARPHARPDRPAAVDWLIAGLGNPGREHERTRHNVGFDVLDELERRWQASAPKQRFKGRLIGDVKPPHGSPAAQTRVALLWPLTYMNDSGRSVGPARGSYRLELDRVLVVHDEIDLPFGEVRTRLGGGLAGHNGLKSLRRELGSPDFWRVRVGVGRPPSSDPEIVSSYVLSRFRESTAEVADLIGGAADAVEALLAEETKR
ncbi:MAG: aminoacyl-tRNA hydrolase [Solirubrobacteraceae bacterium]